MRLLMSISQLGHH